VCVWGVGGEGTKRPPLTKPKELGLKTGTKRVSNKKKKKKKKKNREKNLHTWTAPSELGQSTNKGGALRRGKNGRDREKPGTSIRSAKTEMISVRPRARCMKIKPGDGKEGNLGKNWNARLRGDRWKYIRLEKIHWKICAVWWN